VETLDPTAQALERPITVTREITRLSWRDVFSLVDALACRHAPNRLVYGVPRGGAIVAGLLASRWSWRVLDAPERGCLVVDDLVDSGRTLARYAGPAFVGADGAFTCDVDALVRKPHAPAALAPRAPEANYGWVEFPWEGGETGPEDAVVRLLEHVGEDPTREGILDTPRRVTKALREMTSGYAQDPGEILSRTFDAHGYDQMVVLKGIAFTSLCEHHMLPFTGEAVVGYVPGERVVGLSKLARLVECFARRLQIQERMTVEIRDAIDRHLAPKGTGVIVRAHHGCMSCRGVRLSSTQMITSALSGIVKERPEARAELLALFG
jgi:GTP cyclohydrolase I